MARSTAWCQPGKHRGEEGATPAPTADTAQCRKLYDRISQQNPAPLWLLLVNLAAPEPQSPPARKLTPRRDLLAMTGAGELITAKEVERRPPSFVAECSRQDILVAPSWRRVRH